MYCVWEPILKAKYEMGTYQKSSYYEMGMYQKGFIFTVNI